MYRMKCIGCAENGQREGMYIGETARSIGERASEHLVRYEQNEKNSVFYKRMLELHDRYIGYVLWRRDAQASD